MRQITGPGQRPRDLELRRPESPPMPLADVATLTIRNLDDTVRDWLRQRASDRSHSMEEEVRQIHRQVVKPADTATTSEGLGSRSHNHFAQLGGVALELPSRGDTPAAPDLVNAHPRISLQQRERQNSRFDRY